MLEARDSLTSIQLFCYALDEQGEEEARTAVNGPQKRAHICRVAWILRPVAIRAAVVEMIRWLAVDVHYIRICRVRNKTSGPEEMRLACMFAHRSDFHTHNRFISMQSYKSFYSRYCNFGKWKWHVLMRG